MSPATPIKRTIIAGLVFTIVGCVSVADRLDARANVNRIKIQNEVLACKSGELFRCFTAGKRYERYYHYPGIERNREKSDELYAFGCERGAALSCAHLGLSLRHRGPSHSRMDEEDRRIVKRHRTSALQFLTKACNIGTANWSCLHVGRMYEEGNIALEKNMTEAAKYYSIACPEVESACKRLSKLIAKYGVTSNTTVRQQ